MGNLEPRVMSIAMELWVLAIWADVILHFTQVVLETYTAQLAFLEDRDDENLVVLHVALCAHFPIFSSD